MTNKESDNGLVAFIDLLGFKNAISKDENFEKLKILLSKIMSFSGSYGEKKIAQTEDGNTTYNIRPEVNAFSDSVVISSPYSGIMGSNALVVLSQIKPYIVSIASVAFQEGFLIRGGIAEGKVYHKNGLILGDALIKAVNLEKCPDSRMPMIYVHDEIVKKYNLDQPPGIIYRGKTILSDDHSFLLKTLNNKNKEIFALKYVHEMISQELPHGDKFLEMYEYKVSCMREEISRKNREFTNERMDIKEKWGWFEEYFKKESDRCLNMFRDAARNDRDHEIAEN